MKAFLKKLFFVETPAPGVVTGWTLLFAALWILPGAAGAYLCHGPVFLGVVKVCFSLLLYALILEVGFLLSGAAAYRRHWLLAAARILTLLAAIGCFALTLGSIGLRWQYLLGGCVKYTFWSGETDFFCARIVDAAGPLVFAVAGILLLAGSYLLTARFCALGARMPFEKVFNLPTKILLVLLALSYVFFLGSALAAHRRTENTVKRLEARFGRPLSAAGLEEMYFAGRKRDDGFWKRVEKLTYKIHEEWKDIDFYLHAESGAFTGTFSPDFLRKYRKFYENGRALSERENLFDAPLPADGTKRFVPGDLISVELRELNCCRDLCRAEQWRIRFAAEDKKLAGAYAALARMKNTSDYLGARPAWLISALVMTATEFFRADGMVWLAGNASVPDEVLRSWQKDLLDHDRDLDRVNSDALYAEAVSMDDVCRRIAHGLGLTRDERRFGDRRRAGAVDGLYSLRFLFPQVWRFAADDRNILLSYFDVKKFGDMKQPDYRKGFLSKMLYPYGEGYQSRLDGLSARYRAAAALIGAVLEKRRTGRYPDALKEPPTDPFTGKPMFYRKGLIPVPETVWNGAKKQLEPPVLRQKEGVAVWSAGRNRKNDGGLHRLDVGPSKSDDVRVFFLIPASERK